MSETCKTCRKEFDSGVWMSPQFADEKVLLFCSEKCKKEYIKRKLDRIKIEYPKYYEKIKLGRGGEWWNGKIKNLKHSKLRGILCPKNL